MNANPPTDGSRGLVCRECGGAMRIMESEPHPTLAETDIRVFLCIECGAARALVVPVPPFPRSDSETD